MKSLIDQNLSFRLVDVLLPRFPGSCHVRDVGLAGQDDERIWQLAKDKGFVIVTKDNDFSAASVVGSWPPTSGNSDLPWQRVHAANRGGVASASGRHRTIRDRE